MNTIALNTGRDPDTVCMVVGLGLLGDEIARHFLPYVHRSSSPIDAVTLDWHDPSGLAAELLKIVTRRDAKRVELIWCSGKAGFSSSDDECRSEFDLFTLAVATLSDRFGSGLTVNVLSSAGGLYEECGYVTEISQIKTARPYGEWKLKQELFLTESNIAARIYRLSSVYGVLKPGQRIGLFDALLSRALDGGVALIYARPTTLRDYIFNTDIARYVVQGVLERRESGTKILASGRPMSIDALIKLISSVANKRIKVVYRRQQQNENDIVFANHLVPEDFKIAPLEETVRLIFARTKGGLRSGFSQNLLKQQGKRNSAQSLSIN